MNETSDAAVVVVGAGISGLTCATHLQAKGLDVLVVEAADRPGGTIGSSRQHGCLVESGPNSALDTTPLIGGLLEDTGISAERIDTAPAARNRFILREGRLVALPLSPLALLSTPLFSPAAKLRVLGEPFIGRSQEDTDESVAAFVRRRLGRQFLERAIDPFVAGIFAGDPEQLSVRAAFPRLVALEQEHGSLIVGQIAGARARARDPERSKQSAAMFSFTNGMQTLTDALARGLRRVELSTEVTGVQLDGEGYRLRVVTATGTADRHARVVVLAVPAYVAAKLIALLAPDAAAALADIHYPPVAVVASLYRHGALRHPLDGFGFLVPRTEGRRILGTIFSSTLFAGRAPDGFDLLTTFVGGSRDPALAQREEGEIAEAVQRENASILGAPPIAEWIRVRRWPQAIPQYALGHLGRIARIEEAERANPGLHFCANYRGGVSVGDCVKSADATASRVLAQVRPCCDRNQVTASARL